MESNEKTGECNLTVDLIIVYYVNFSCDGVIEEHE